MLQTMIDNDADQHFPAIDRDGAKPRMTFISRSAHRQRPLQPHWARACESERDLTALERWFFVRRDRWPAWGELAEEIGTIRFNEHMATTLEAEPPEHVVSTTIERLDDDRDIALGQVLAGLAGERTEVLHVHRFASAAMRDSFLKWLETGENRRLAKTLLAVGFDLGSIELGKTLDAFAERPDDPAAQAAPREKTE